MHVAMQARELLPRVFTLTEREPGGIFSVTLFPQEPYRFRFRGQPLAGIIFSWSPDFPLIFKNLATPKPAIIRLPYKFAKVSCAAFQSK